MLAHLGDTETQQTKKQKIKTSKTKRDKLLEKKKPERAFNAGDSECRRSAEQVIELLLVVSFQIKASLSSPINSPSNKQENKIMRSFQ